MNLKELSKEYRESGLACKTRAERLKPLLDSPELCELEKLRLRRRIYTLEQMARDTFATAAYLNNYYGGDDLDNGEQRNEISGTAEFYEAGIGGLGAGALRHGGGADRPPAAACGAVLSAANANALYCR